MRHIIIVLLLLFPLSALAGVYKCNVDGKIVYQQTPCANASGTDTGIKTHGYRTNPTVAPRSGLRPGEIRKLEQIRARKQARQQARRAAELARPTINIPKPVKKDCFGKPAWAGSRCRDANKKRLKAYKERVRQAERAGAKVTHFPQSKAPLSSAVADLEKENQRLRNEAQWADDEAQNDFPDMTPIPTSDGRWLYPNDPDGNTFNSSDGKHFIRQGEQVVNPQSGERFQLH